MFNSLKLQPKGKLSYLPVDKQGAELLCQAISNRHECGSIGVTTNRDFKDWETILNVLQTGII